MDRFRRRGQPPLQHGEREPDRALLLPADRVRPVELLPDIVGNLVVEAPLGVAQPVLHRVRDPLREQRLAVEAEQVLLDHPAHQVGSVRRRRVLSILAFEGVAVEQRQEQLVVGFDPPVRRRRHQEQVPRPFGEEPAQPVPPGVFHLAAEVTRRHLVRFVADDQVVPAVRCPEPGLHLLVARQHVQAGDPVRRLEEPVAGGSGVPPVAGEDLEVEAEAFREFLLPLLHQTSRTDDETPPGVAPRQQFLDEQPGHDRLAGAGVVGEQETQRLAREHRFIDRGDLVRQRIHLRGLHRQERVEEVRQRDALRFRRELEQFAVAVEGPGPLFLGRFEPLLVLPEEQSFADGSLPVAEDDRGGVRAVAFDADDGRRAAAGEPPDRGVRDQVFEFHRAPADAAAAANRRRPAVVPRPGFRPARDASPTRSAAPGLTRSRTRGCGTSGCGCSRSPCG